MNLEIGAAASWTNRLLSTPPSTAAPFCGLNSVGRDQGSGVCGA